VHPGARWLAIVSVSAIGIQSWTVLLAALRGRLTRHRLSQAPGVEPLERFGHRLNQPALATGVLVVLYSLGGVHVVPPGHQAVIERLGKPLEAAHPAGLVLQLPPPIDRVRLIDVSITQQVPLMDATTPLLCQDETMVALEMSLHFSVSDAHDYIFGAEDPASTVAMMGRSALIETIAARTQDEVLVTDIQQIEAEVLARTQATTDTSQLGVKIQSIHLIQSAVPTPVLSAFLDVASAKADEETLFKIAKAYEYDRLPRTRGEAQTLITTADIDQAERVAEATIDHDYFIALTQGIAADRGLSMDRIRLEHIESALKKANLIISPESIQLWLDSSTRLQPTKIPALEGP